MSKLINKLKDKVGQSSSSSSKQEDKKPGARKLTEAELVEEQKFFEKVYDSCFIEKNLESWMLIRKCDRLTAIGSHIKKDDFKIGDSYPWQHVGIRGQEREAARVEKEVGIFACQLPIAYGRDGQDFNLKMGPDFWEKAARYREFFITKENERRVGEDPLDSRENVLYCPKIYRGRLGPGGTGYLDSETWEIKDMSKPTTFTPKVNPVEEEAG